MSDVFKAGVLATFGLVEGYAFAKSGIVTPQMFRDQMTFESMGIMKLFLSAVGCSMVFQSIMAWVMPTKFEPSRFYTYSSVGYPRAMSGCFTLGVGMFIAGSGPTMIPAQIGAGVLNAAYIVLGGMIGGAVFAMIEPTVFSKPIPKATREETSLDGVLKTSYSNVAMPFGLALIGASLGLEALFPHSPDIARIAGINIPGAMIPTLAGLTVGFNQIPIRYITNDGQGGSSSVMTIISTLTGGKISPRHRARKVSDAYQFFYVYVGTGLGAYLAVQSTNNYSIAPGFTPAISMLGGALAIFGARVANGCTCGHGISGMSELSLSSFAAGMSIFAGGICAGMVNKYILQ